MLNSLPESLDETYERMLCNINYHLAEDARRILTLLCFARRPLTVQELIEGVAVEINGDSSRLNHKRRLPDSDGTRDICGVFIDIYVAEKPKFIIADGEDLEDEKVTETVRIAHFSIQEYLESERIRHPKAAAFSLTGATAHAEIAQICLTYLCERGLSQSELNLSIIKDHPLAYYAARYWYFHYDNTASLASSLNIFILKLFQCQSSFVTWIRLHDPDGHDHEIYGDKSIRSISRPLNRIPTPIYYASLLGLDQTLRALISIWQDETEVSKQINAKGGKFRNALQAASFSGQNDVIQLLLDRGVDVNAQGGFFGNALQAASSLGRIQIVQLLLEKGAHVNAQGGGFYRNALQAASYNGRDEVVRLLLDKGAVLDTESLEILLRQAKALEYDRVVQLVQDHEASLRRKLPVSEGN